MNLRQFINYIFSRAKWQKVAFIARDQLATIYQLFRSIRANDCSSLTDAASLLSSTNFSESSYISTIEIPENIAQLQSLDKKTQDTIISNKVKTELLYVSAKILNASMYTDGARHQSVFDGHGRRVEEFSYGELPWFSNNVLVHRPAKRIDGLSLNLCGTIAIAGGNYGHWLIDGYARLGMALGECDLSEFTHVVVPTLKYDFHYDSLLNVGIQAEKIIELKPLDCIQFERLVCISSPRGSSSSIVPGWIIDFYQNYASGVIGQQLSAERVYISRKDAPGRNIKNEESIIAMLEKYDFQIIELSQFRYDEKVSIFKNARIVVGLSGAGLVNLMFANPNLKVIEIMPRTSASYLFASISAYLGIRHEVLIFDKTSTLKYLNPYYGSFEVDQAELEELVVKAIYA